MHDHSKYAQIHSDRLRDHVRYEYKEDVSADEVAEVPETGHGIAEDVAALVAYVEAQ